MRNVHVLLTDKPSRFVKNNLGLIRITDNFTQSDLDFIQAEFINIYITSDEEIKDGDWYLNNGYILKCTEIKKRSGCKKIILARDQDLIKDGVQAIPDDFLEWFEKNPSCEEVKVIKQELNTDYRSDWKQKFYYKIIIPKEEPKQKTNDQTDENGKTLRYWGGLSERSYIEVSEQEFLAEFEKPKVIIQYLHCDEWLDFPNQLEVRIKPTPDYSKEIEALQEKAKENGMKVTINFEKI